MKYPYRVKHDGVWYEVGAEVPNGNNSTAEKVVEKSVLDEPKPKTAPKGRKKTEE